MWTRVHETIRNLHVHAGVRRDNLSAVLCADVRAAWHIGSSDTVEKIRAKAIGQLYRVFGTLIDTNTRLIAEVLLNMSYDLSLCASHYEERRVALAKRGYGLSPSTTYRKLIKDVYPAVVQAVRAGAEPLDDGEVDRIVHAERRHLAALLANAPRRHDEPDNSQLDRFLSNDVYLSRPPQPGAYPAVDIPGHGKWIKVFTSLSKLARELGSDTGEWLSMSPADLVKDVHAADRSVGLLVDLNTAAPLILNPEIVRRLAERQT